MTKRFASAVLNATILLFATNLSLTPPPLLDDPFLSECDDIPLPNLTLHYDYARCFPNFSHFELDRDWTNDVAYLPSAVTLWATFVVGILSNLFVVLVLVAGRKLHQSVTSTILVSLAVSDVVLLAVCVPYELFSKHVLLWRGGEAMCKVAGFVEMLSAAASVLNLTAVSLER